MFHHILVPLDGSKRAEEVLPTAFHLARTTGASLTLLRVVTLIPTFASVYSGASYEVMAQLYSQEQEKAEEYLSAITPTEDLGDVPVYREVYSGVPAQCIVQSSQAHHVDLIIMSSHGETGLKGWFLGSVARDVMRHSSVPVLVIRDVYYTPLIKSPILHFSPRILVPLDGSPEAEDILEPAASLIAALAKPMSGSLHLTQIVPYQSYTEEQEVRARAETYLNTIQQRFQTGDLASFNLAVTTSVVICGDDSKIWQHILDESQCIGDVRGNSGCDIIAMVTHGRYGLQRILQGSITESVLGATTQPLLVVHPQPEHMNSPLH